MLETIRALPSASSITPTFDYMAVDTSWERKVLKKVTWLQIPGTHALISPADGNGRHFSWRKRYKVLFLLLTNIGLGLCISLLCIAWKWRLLANVILFK